MPKGQSLAIQDTRVLLKHIQSLGGVASREEVGSGAADTLIHEGLLQQVWIGSYALTEAGEQLIGGLRD